MLYLFTSLFFILYIPTKNGWFLGPFTFKKGNMVVLVGLTWSNINTENFTQSVTFTRVWVSHNYVEVSHFHAFIFKIFHNHVELNDRQDFFELSQFKPIVKCSLIKLRLPCHSFCITCYEITSELLRKKGETFHMITQYWVIIFRQQYISVPEIFILKMETKSSSNSNPGSSQLCNKHRVSITADSLNKPRARVAHCTPSRQLHTQGRDQTSRWVGGRGWVAACDNTTRDKKVQTQRSRAAKGDGLRCNSFSEIPIRKSNWPPTR